MEVQTDMIGMKIWWRSVSVAFCKIRTEFSLALHH